MTDLTICVPTRNRQRYCIETIRALARSDARNFDVIVADNSDDASVLADFFANDFHDERFRLLPPGDRVYSMVDNWERTMPEVTGRWVSFIGDDDYLDPRAADLIARYEKTYPDVEAVGWGRMAFNWPDNRPDETIASIPAGSTTYVSDQSKLQDVLYRWSERKSKPASGYGVYHGAVKRSLMERIKARFGGRYFEHPNVDYDSACKVTLEGKRLVSCQRPFSVLGACGASNSAGLQSAMTMTERTKTFNQENEHNVPVACPGFPFPLSGGTMSVCVSVAHMTYWFCTTYGVDLTGFGENFAASAMEECAAAWDEEHYAFKVAAFKEAFAEWEGGRWAAGFAPGPYNPERVAFRRMSGVFNNVIYLQERKLKAQTPYEFYRFGEHAVLPVKHVMSGRKVFTT